MASASASPQRRSAYELMASLESIFDELDSDKNNPDSTVSPGFTTSRDGKRTAPLRKLPDLISAFERKRGIEILSEEEMGALSNFSQSMPEERVGVKDLIGIFQAMGVTQGIETPFKSRPSPLAENTTTTNPSDSAARMLLPAAELTTPGDGSPVPRRIRTPSSASTSSKLSVRSTASTSSVKSSTSLSSPSRINPKRRSFLTAITGSPGKASPGADLPDLASLVTAAGGTYLGVKLEGPLGAGWDVDRYVAELRKATKGPGTQEKLVLQVLADKTYPQIRSIDKAYFATHGKTLLELIASERSVRGYVEFTLRGLIMGPLNWDVDLLKRALDGQSKNEDLLVELLVGRHPHDLELLRVAFERRQSASGSPEKMRNFNHTITSAGSSAKIKKVWETVLEARWDDVGDAFDGEVGGQDGRTHQQRLSLLKEDIDQLKVALRPGGNTDMITKILLARSPRHIHSIVIEFAKGGQHLSLTHTIKQHFSGVLLKILLFAVENGKKDHDGPEVWRDAKMLYKCMEGAGTRNEQLAWRLVRGHWDRSRFQLVVNAFRRKYNRSLHDTVKKDTSGTWRDLALLLVDSASKPEPEPTPEDIDRLASLKGRSRGSSVSSVQSASSESSEKDQTMRVLEGSGELPQPPSPTAPPVPDNDSASDTSPDADNTPMLSSFPRFQSQPDLSQVDDPPSTPTLPTSASVPDNLGSSTSSMESNSSIPIRGHKASSSLSFRQRSSPLEPLGHRPPSSAGGSGSRSDKPSSALRHNRPIAPARNNRRMSEELARSGSSEPLERSGSMSPTFARSPTPSSGHSDRAQSPAFSSFARSMSTSSVATSSGEDQVASEGLQSPSSLGPIDTTSPPSAIDFTTYHALPISPIGDFGGPLATSEPYPFTSLGPLATTAEEYFTGNDSSPEKSPSSHALRRDNSTASSGGGSRPGSLFFGEGNGGLGQGYRPDSTASIFTLFGNGKGTGDQFQTLLRQAQDLAKRLKETESRLEVTTSTFEQEQSDLESRLEDARAELATKRREEKELRGNEKQHLAQISSLEGDIAKVTKSLERSRESYETMKKSYQLQCEETEKLRTVTAEVRRENRAAEEAAQGHTLQVHQFERDREILQTAINKLEEDLNIARQAQDSLDDQKQENLLLKETIDRLKFEIDDMRTTGRKSIFLDGPNSTPSSVEGSISRSLGKELARRLENGEESEESDGDATEGEDADDSVDSIVVTTRHVKKKRAPKGDASRSLPITTHVEETTFVADAEAQTDAIATASMDVQTDLVAVGTEVFVQPVTLYVVEELPPKSGPELEAELAKTLGIDLTLLKDYLAKPPTLLESPPRDKPASESSLTPRRGARWTSRLSSRMSVAANAPAYFISVFPPSARPYIAQFLENTTSFALYSIVVYLSGFLTGTYFSPYRQLVPFQMIIGSHDKALWTQYNTFGAAFGEGISTAGRGGGGGVSESLLYYVNRLIWGSMGAVRRIPT